MQDEVTQVRGRKRRAFLAEGALFCIDIGLLGVGEGVMGEEKSCNLSFSYSPHSHSYPCRKREKSNRVLGA